MNSFFFLCLYTLYLLKTVCQDEIFKQVWHGFDYGSGICKATVG